MARGSLADFTDKVEHTEQIHSACRPVSRNFNSKKSVTHIAAHVSAMLEISLSSVNSA